MSAASVAAAVPIVFTKLLIASIGFVAQGLMHNISAADGRPLPMPPRVYIHSGQWVGPALEHGAQHRDGLGADPAGALLAGGLHFLFRQVA